MKRNALLVALALVLAPVAAHAQGSAYGAGQSARGGWGPGRRGGAIGMADVANPLKPLLDRSRELGFTDAQANELLAAMQKLDDDNRPLFDQIQRAFSAGQTQAGSGGPMEAARPYFLRIQRNNEAAWRAAIAPLTKEQRSRAERMRRDIEKQREDERRKRQPRDQGDQGGGLMQQP